MKSEMVQITAGRGPAECAWIVAQVLKIFLKEARLMEFKVEVVNKIQGNLNLTLASAVVRLTGDEKKLSAFINTWEGSILWIGQSQFRKYHKRKNWFIGVNRARQLKSESIDESLIEYSAVRSGGPGGQHVNKVSTAIRAVYKPLNLQVLVSESRSQLQNKKIAKARLLSRMQSENEKQSLQTIQENWDNHNSLERGNPIRTFEGIDFKSRYKNKKYAAKRQTEKQQWRNKELGE